MNDFVPSWNMDDDYRSFHDLLPQANHRKAVRSDNELIELVWQNGHVVMHSQSNREANTAINDKKEMPKLEVASKGGGAIMDTNNLIQEDETAAWIQYSLDDAFGKDFSSDFLYGMPVAENLEKDALTGDPLPKQTSRLQIEENPMPPPNMPAINSTNLQVNSAKINNFVNFSHFSRPAFDKGLINQNYGEKVFKNRIQGEVGESSSMITKLSGNWGNNKVQKNHDSSHSLSNADSEVLPKKLLDGQKKFHERVTTETHDTTTVTSSSGGSGCSVGRTRQRITGNQNHKRKGRDAEESESQSEEVECQSVDEGRQPRRSSSARRSRAAEVHNLSERRRRDRINEKMKALQDLIPHCNKTDKASMLDEAIEYLKTLQLQVQIMWMGGGMAPMMFPNPQQYLSLMGRGMSHGTLPSIPGAMQMPSLSMVNQGASSATANTQAMLTPSPNMNPVNFTNQMQSANMPDAYSRYLGFHQMQLQPRAVNLFNPYESQFPQSSQITAVTGSSDLSPSNGITLSENGKSG